MAGGCSGARGGPGWIVRGHVGPASFLRVPDGFEGCRFKADRTHQTIFCRKAGMQMAKSG